MNLFLSEGETPFARRLVETANEQGIRLVTTIEKNGETTHKPEQDKKPQFPCELPWNRASIFSIRLVLRQCQYFWGEQTPADYMILLSSNLGSISLNRNRISEIQLFVEQRYLGALLLLRELDALCRKFASHSIESNRIIFVVLEDNAPLELLGSSAFQGLYAAFDHYLKNNLEYHILGFYSKSSNYEAYSNFIIQTIQKKHEKTAGKWFHFKDTWNPMRSPLGSLNHTRRK